MKGQAGLYCHSHFSCEGGASSLGRLVAGAVALGYPALALTNHNNLCGAMKFARLTRSPGHR
ncbi:Error-prone DNA polymerase [bacterium HR23]|nr:Error-prone DNA polymerase [bacterium HR23]